MHAEVWGMKCNVAALGPHSDVGPGRDGPVVHLQRRPRTQACDGAGLRRFPRNPHEVQPLRLLLYLTTLFDSI